MKKKSVSLQKRYEIPKLGFGDGDILIIRYRWGRTARKSVSDYTVIDFRAVLRLFLDCFL